jgi:hypothetical protein
MYSLHTDYRYTASLKIYVVIFRLWTAIRYAEYESKYGYGTVTGKRRYQQCQKPITNKGGTGTLFSIFYLVVYNKLVFLSACCVESTIPTPNL